MILALIFLGESLTITQVFAVSVVLIGVTLVSLNFQYLKNKRTSLAKGVKETILASFAFAIYWNLDKILSIQMGWLTASFWVKVVAVSTLVIMSLLKKESIPYQNNVKNLLPIVVLIGVLEAAAVASVNYGLSVGQLVLVSPISSALSIVTITLSIIFLKEKVSKTQAIGIFLTISGIVITAF